MTDCASGVLHPIGAERIRLRPCRAHATFNRI
jgi:hypothetical protein